MITNIGKRIKIQCLRDYFLERDADTPGAVTVRRDDQEIRLPGNPDDAEEFIRAYRRALSEDIKYRQSDAE